MLVVSAHSLPKGLIERNNDPYPQELTDTMNQLQTQSAIQHVAQGGNQKGTRVHLGLDQMCKT